MERGYWLNTTTVIGWSIGLVNRESITDWVVMWSKLSWPKFRSRISGWLYRHLAREICCSNVSVAYISLPKISSGSLSYKLVI